MIQEVDQKIVAVRHGFQRAKSRQTAFGRALRDYDERLRKSESSTREDIEKCLIALHGVLNQPELVEQQLLVDYIKEVLRFVGDVGLGYEFGEAFIDRAMHVYKQAGYSLTELFLMKAHFLPINDVEHPAREKIFLEARSYAQEHGEQEGLVRVLLGLSGYYTTTSQYKKSIAECKECEQLIQLNSQLQKYYSPVLTNLGINYFTLLDIDRARPYLLQAYELLIKEVTEQNERGDAYTGKRTLGTVLHYLGRIAEMQGDLQSTMQYYVEGHRYQQLASENLDAIAFYHLRMGELLTSASLLDLARDHLEQSQKMINDIVIAGTAHPQLRLAWATIYNKEGLYEKARECILGALDESRQRHTSRIELRCLLKLFRLEIRYLRPYRAIYTGFQILKTRRGGELKRNEAFIPAQMWIVLKFLWHFTFPFLKGRKRHTPLLTCICPIHHIEYENSTVP